MELLALNTLYIEANGELDVQIVLLLRLETATQILTVIFMIRPKTRSQLANPATQISNFLQRASDYFIIYDKSFQNIKQE